MRTNREIKYTHDVAYLLTMKHKGEIVEKAVRKSGITITTLAKKIGYSRRHVYTLFDNANLGIDIIIKIGKAIHHNFSEEFSEIAKPPFNYVDDPDTIVKDSGWEYPAGIDMLRSQISILQENIKDKDRIIKMLEEEVKRLKKKEK